MCPVRPDMIRPSTLDLGCVSKWDASTPRLCNVGTYARGSFVILPNKWPILAIDNLAELRHDPTRLVKCGSSRLLQVRSVHESRG